MDDEERKRKLEAGKAKLAHYRKKKHSKKKKHDAGTPVSTPRDASHSEEVEACDSTAVQTGDDSSMLSLTPSDDSERSSTTADDISTEEEGGFNLQLSSIERMQELELTVSDQQAALQKLTLENKALHEKNAAAVAEKAVLERDSVINELRDSVAQSAQHVRHLQQQLTKTTSAFIDTGGQQGEIVAELTDTRQKLDTYQTAIVRQEAVLQQMAKKLEDKSIEAGDAMQRCQALELELEKSQSQIASSQQHVSDEMLSMQEELKREKEALSVELDQRFEEIKSMKREHKMALDEEIRKRKMMEAQQSAVYDPEDARAYREQAELLRSQLETAYRDIDKLKRDHDKEVIELNQQLVNSVDEYETKLEEERRQCENLEQRLDMSDTVSTEIQASFSKQLAQLEEEREMLRQQVRQAQTQAKEHSASKTRVNSLEDEVINYQTELAQLSNRLEGAEKQKRQFRDDVERSQEAMQKLKNEKLQLETSNEELNDKVLHQNNVCGELNQKIMDLMKDNEATTSEHQDLVAELNAHITELQQTSEREGAKVGDDIKAIHKEHSEELKNLHSQHHRQMDELKKEMEQQLESTKCGLDDARKEQLETVKDVHERSRDREFSRVKEHHEEKVREMADNHMKEIEALKIETQEVKELAEERLRFELKEQFDAQLEKELSLLRHGLEQDTDLSQVELIEKHREEVERIKADHEAELNECIKTELEKQKSVYEDRLADQKAELDKAVENMKLEFDQAQETMANEHTEALTKMESAMEEFHDNEEQRSASSVEQIKKLEDELNEKVQENRELAEKVMSLEEQFENQVSDADDENRAAILDEKRALSEKCAEYQTEIDELKEELLTVQTERDDIFSQAEESQKRLAALHHEDAIRMQEEVDQLEASHQEKVEHMQYEIESLRTSRNDLQDLRSQLLARNASVEEISRIREEFAEEKESLLKEMEEEKAARENSTKKFNEELEKLKLAHQLEMENEQERITQLLQDLEESREKLDEMTSSATPLESSPMRSISQMSDYDSANVAALNKDYRSAMTLTHVSGVSGLSESLVPVAEETQESGTALEEEVVALRKQVEENQAAIDRLKQEHAQTITEAQEEYEEQVKIMNETNQERTDGLLQTHKDEMQQLEDQHNSEVKQLKDCQQKEMMQIHVQCASDTAKQIDEETTNIRGQFNDEMEKLKQQLELENEEQLESERKKHTEELSEQSSHLSSSMEVRISAVMEEMHEQKQQALQKAFVDHEKELSELREELDLKLKEASQKLDVANQAWKEREMVLETMVEDLKAEMEKSQQEYRNIINGLDNGDNEYIMSLQSKHEEELEYLRKRLVTEHEERQENSLRKQADTYEQAQSEFMKLHKDQFDKFIAAQKKDAEASEQETGKRLEEVRRRMMEEHNLEKQELTASHVEEMKVVATKLVEIDAEKEKLENVQNDLLSEIDAIKAQNTEELSELKTHLVNQHMVKFQELTVNLDQLHKEEMTKVREQHQEKVHTLREELDSYQERVDELEGVRRKEKDQLESMILPDEMDEKLKEVREKHEEELRTLQEDHDSQLQQIEEEIQRQAEEHKESTQRIKSLQSGDLDGLQKQFDEALSKAVEASTNEIQGLKDRIMELETELQGKDQLRTELDETKMRKEEVEAMAEEWSLKMQAWEEDRNEEREAYEKKLNEISESFNNLQEEHKDLNARIEFERAECEAELEMAQEETRNKDENVKELGAEIDEKNAALENLAKQHQQLTERQERENREGDNLLKMLRDDLERLNRERDSIHSSNDQLLSALSDLVRTNHRCEDMIVKRLENLPIVGTDATQTQVRQNAAHPPAADAADSDSSNTPPTTSLSESFIDEGLDLSQRFTESMFAGPELDPAARDVITSAGTKVGQATERLLDMLENTIKEFNTSQQAQTLLGNELQRVMTSKQEEPGADDVTSKMQQDLLQATEELANEKLMLMEQYQEEKNRLMEAARIVEEASEKSAKATEEKESEYLAQIEDFKTQIACLRKQRESGSKLTAELTEDREAERDEFEKEMEAMRNEIDQVRDSAKTEALLMQKVGHLEEELDIKQQVQEERDAEVEILKEKLQDRDNLVTDLREHIKSQQLYDNASELTDLQSQLEDARTQGGVLQKELQEKMLRISALETQLDRYRHGIDEDALAALEKSEAEERRMKELAVQEIEAKEQEIEALIEQQSRFQKQLIEKEEEVGKILEEMEDVDELKAENNHIKEELERVTVQLCEQTSTPADHLGALSKQLIDEKNAEIDDLRQQMALLQSDDKEHNFQQALAFLQSQIRELESENELLKEEVRARQDPIEISAQADPLQEVGPKETSNEEDTGIQDLSVADLTQPEVIPTAEPELETLASNLQRLEEENDELRQELEQAKEEAEVLLLQIQKENLLKIFPETKQKILDLQEQLEAGDVTMEETQTLDELREIEEELRSYPDGVLARILCDKHEALDQKQFLIDELENLLNMKQQELAESTEQTSLKEVDTDQDTSETSSLSSEDEMEEEDQDGVERKDPDGVEREDPGEMQQLKILLSEKEDEILRCETMFAEQQDLVVGKDEQLAILTAKVDDAENKFNEVSNALESRSTELDLEREGFASEISSLQTNIAQIQEELNEKSMKIDQIASERDRISEQLDDVQREYSSLLEENRKLVEEQPPPNDDVSEQQAKIDELETMIGKYDQEKIKVQKKEGLLMDKIQCLNEELQEMKLKVVGFQKSRDQIQADYDKLSSVSTTLPDEIQRSGAVHAGGDTKQMQVTRIVTPSDEEESVEVARLTLENETLKEEISNLTFKTEELQIDLEMAKQSHVTEHESVIGQSNGDVSKLQQLYESTRIEAPPQTRRSSSSSSTTASQLEELEDLKREYQRKIEEIKREFARELEEAVAKASRDQEELDQRRISELEDKHRHEITELLSESGISDNELAQRLRSELDLADKLDHELINQLTAVAQNQAQPIGEEQSSISSTSPAKEAEISTRLQHLLSRLHNEGVQVLSLSELQFLKQHQPLKNVSFNTDQSESQDSIPPYPSVDVDGLRRAWESEKLALLDAIQSLKELLTQTATDAAQLCDDDDSLRWRGDLLRSVADLFEREKHALLAELRACVIDAHGEVGDEPTATSRLESLERKIRSQEMQHRSELERLLAADRDQLADDVRELKAERKEKIEQASKRIEDLQELHRASEEGNKIAIKHLQNEVECLRRKLEQEEALASDLRTSLEQEKQMSGDLVPSLEQERQRTIELSHEIVTMGDRNEEQAKELIQDNDNLRSKVDVISLSLSASNEKIQELQVECESRQRALVIAKSQQDQLRNEDHEAITNLQNSLSLEEMRRVGLEQALENEKHKVKFLEQDLSESGKVREEVQQWRSRCDDLTCAVQTERGRCDELQSALELEATRARHARMELENERKMTSEVRDQERATIADLQVILEDAKEETEKVHRRVEVAEQDRDEAMRKAEEIRISAEKRLEHERSSREDALDNEREARIELQTALDTEKIRKEDMEVRMQELANRHHELLKHQELSPPSSQEALLSSRRQLESLRQRLQLEASKFQNLIDRTSGRPSPRGHVSHDVSPGSSLLSSDGERFESLKRSLQDMQGELKDLYTELSLPQRHVTEHRSDRPIEFNDRLLKQNADLAQFAADAAKETRELRDAIDALHQHQRQQRHSGEEGPQTSNENQQKMANRIHKLYTRYLRAESFRKSLVYQKKYLLLLLGGFQDCEEATLAMIARMGAYPSDDALRRTVTHRSEAFTKFRSAARAVIAVCRLRFLVRKWKRASNTVSNAIQSKHGVTVAASGPTVNGTSHDRVLSPGFPHSSPSPRLDPDRVTRDFDDRHQPVTSQSPRYRYSNDPPSRDTSPFTSGSHLASPYNPHLPSSSYGYHRDGPYSTYTDDHRRYSPAIAHSYPALERSTAAGSDPSLNDYIQKLENIQTKLRYPR